MTVRVLVIPGSNRSASVNRKLASAAAAELAAQGAIVTQVSLSDYPLPIYDGDLEAEKGRPQEASRLIELFERNDGVLIVSPEYNAGISPLLKNTLDWMSRGEGKPYRNRVFAIASASPGRYGGLRGLMMLRQTLGIGHGALVIPEQFVLPGARSAFNDDGTVAETSNPDGLKAMVRALIRVAGQLRVSAQ